MRSFWLTAWVVLTSFFWRSVPDFGFEVCPRSSRFRCVYYTFESLQIWRLWQEIFKAQNDLWLSLLRFIIRNSESEMSIVVWSCTFRKSPKCKISRHCFLGSRHTICSKYYTSLCRMFIDNIYQSLLPSTKLPRRRSQSRGQGLLFWQRLSQQWHTTSSSACPRVQSLIH